MNMARSEHNLAKEKAIKALISGVTDDEVTRFCHVRSLFWMQHFADFLF